MTLISDGSAAKALALTQMRSADAIGHLTLAVYAPEAHFGRTESIRRAITMLREALDACDAALDEASAPLSHAAE